MGTCICWVESGQSRGGARVEHGRTTTGPREYHLDFLNRFWESWAEDGRSTGGTCQDHAHTSHIFWVDSGQSLGGAREDHARVLPRFSGSILGNPGAEHGRSKGGSRQDHASTTWTFWVD